MSTKESKHSQNQEESLSEISSLQVQNEILLREGEDSLNINEMVTDNESQHSESLNPQDLSLSQKQNWKLTVNDTTNPQLRPDNKNGQLTTVEEENSNMHQEKNPCCAFTVEVQSVSSLRFLNSFRNKTMVFNLKINSFCDQSIESVDSHLLQFTSGGLDNSKVNILWTQMWKWKRRNRELYFIL